MSVESFRRVVLAAFDVLDFPPLGQARGAFEVVADFSREVWMKLPQSDHAVIDLRKVTDYCLSPDHEDGQHKARLFQTLLGLTINDADELIAALRHVATTEEVVLGKADKYGQRYVIDFRFTGPIGTATIRSAWMIRTNETAPRLVTCFVL